jgi:hypothetical protein
MAQVSGGEVQDIIRENALKNPQYREALLSDPKALLSKQMGRDLPDWLTVKVVEERPDTIYLIAPYVPKEGEELSDSALESVAGGKDEDKGNTYICNDSIGMGTRIELNLG